MPGLRRLLDPGRRPDALPDLGVRRENTVFVSGIGCSSPLPLLHEHLRLALDPRSGAGDRHRPRRHPPRSRRLGRHRRRRRAFHRRQPPRPRPSPQRESHDPAVQQPDLRADQGPVLADLRARQDDQVDARSGRSTSPFNPISLALGAEATLRRPHASTWTAST